MLENKVFVKTKIYVKRNYQRFSCKSRMGFHEQYIDMRIINYDELYPIKIVIYLCLIYLVVQNFSKPPNLQLQRIVMQNCKRLVIQIYLKYILHTCILSEPQVIGYVYLIFVLKHLVDIHLVIKVCLFSLFRSVKAEDAGKYECQVSTEPKLSHFVHLTVIGK